jgi:hypothetical protein
MVNVLLLWRTTALSLVPSPPCIVNSGLVMVDGDTGMAHTCGTHSSKKKMQSGLWSLW